MIDLIQELLDTGCCELIAEPYSHGLSSLINEKAFREDVQHLCEKVEGVFNCKPKIFRNSCSLYSDEIGRLVYQMGFKGMLTEGAKHILGWKSPHFVYNSSVAPKLKLLLRDNRLSEDISFRFNNYNWSEYPLFADTYIKWIDELPEDEQVVNIFMELCALGIFQPLSSNILDFMKALPAEAQKHGIAFATPSEVCKNQKSVGPINVPDAISWVDEERDVSPWLGNVMQQDAYHKLYSIADRVLICNDRKLKQDWDYLQATNNFRFMSTKAGSENAYRGIYDSPFDAFTNYMNIIGDFITRVNNMYPDLENEEISPLLTTIKNQDDELKRKDNEIEKLQKTLQLLKSKEQAKAKKKAPKKSVPKKAEKAAE